MLLERPKILDIKEEIHQTKTGFGLFRVCYYEYQGKLYTKAVLLREIIDTESSEILKLENKKETAKVTSKNKYSTAPILSPYHNLSFFKNYKTRAPSLV